MSDRHDIVLSEAPAPGNNPPGLVSELRDLVMEMFPDVGSSGRRWMRGKSEQETAKAMEIRASALEKLGRLDLERQKLIQQRDAVLRDDVLEQEKNRLTHAEKMFELRTQRLKAVVEALRTVKELDVTLTAKAVKRLSDALVSSLGDDD